MYSCSEDGTVKIWDLRSQGYQRELKCHSGSTLTPCNSVALCPDQQTLITGDQSGAVRVWDLGTSSCIQEIVPEADGTPIRAVSAGEDGKRVIAANNNAEVFVWDVENGKRLKDFHRFLAHKEGYCIKAKLSPDCQTLVTTGSDRTARLFSTQTWQLKQPPLAQHQQWVWDAVFSADSSYLVTASSDHSARLWSLKTGEVVRQYTGHFQAVTAVALNDST